MKRYIILNAESGELICTSNSIERARAYAEEHLRTADNGSTVVLFGQLETATKAGVVWSGTKAVTKPPGTRRRWTTDELRSLAKMLKEKYPDKDIAAELGRTRASVHAKLAKMGWTRDSA